MREGTLVPEMVASPAPAILPAGPFGALREQARRNLELQQRVRAFFTEEREDYVLVDEPEQ